MSVPIIVLADYDNVTERQEVTAADAEYNLERLGERLSRVIATAAPSCSEALVRLYGGWITKDGSYSKRGEQLLASVHALKSRFNGIRFRGDIALHLLARPAEMLLGTFRRDQVDHQKMVDGMIMMDALYLGKENSCHTAIASDDDDFIPLMLMMGHWFQCSRRHFAFRARSLGAGLNDELVTKAQGPSVHAF